MTTKYSCNRNDSSTIIFKVSDVFEMKMSDAPVKEGLKMIYFNIEDGFVAGPV